MKFCHPMRQTWVETSQYPCVISPNPVGYDDKVMKHSKVALFSICVQCTPLPYRLYSYLGNIQVSARVGNSSYQVRKPVILSGDFTVPLRYFTQSCWIRWQSYETLKGRPLLNLCTMHPITIPIIFISGEYPGISPGWKFQLSSQETSDPVCERHCPVRKRSMFFDYQKCQQLMLTGAVEGYWHIRGGPFSPGLPQGLLFPRILCNSLFRLCTLSDFSAYLTRTVEKETTRVSIVCHSIRTVLVVRWHHNRAITLR